jgi:K+-sensing histidine kinase KdpD
MTKAIFIGLINSSALMISLGLIAMLFIVSLLRSRIPYKEFFIGAIIGFSGFIIIIAGVRLFPGIIFDTKSVLLCLSGLFLGTIPTLVGAVFVIIFRASLQGPGVFAEIMIVITSAVAGIVWKKVKKVDLLQLSFADMYIFGVIVHIFMLACWLTLPWHTASYILLKIALPVIVLFPLTTALLGMLMRNMFRKIKADEEMVKKNQLIEALNKELDQKVRDRTQQLLTTNQEMEALVYSLSHDLKSALKAFNITGDNLKIEIENCLDEEKKLLFSSLEQNNTRMGGLIDNLVILSRISKTGINLKDVNLSQIINNVLNDISRDNPDLQVKFDIAEDIIAKADEALLTIALRNMLTSAVKFASYKTNPRIEFFVTEDAGKRIFNIRDNGESFETKYSDQLFVAFNRLNTKEDFQNTVISLAIVKRIVEKHGGKVWAESELKQGATFKFTLV